MSVIFVQAEQAQVRRAEGARADQLVDEVAPVRAVVAGAARLGHEPVDALRRQPLAHPLDQVLDLLGRPHPGLDDARAPRRPPGGQQRGTGTGAAARAGRGRSARAARRGRAGSSGPPRYRPAVLRAAAVRRAPTTCDPHEVQIPSGRRPAPARRSGRRPAATGSSPHRSTWVPRAGPAARPACAPTSTRRGTPASRAGGSPRDRRGRRRCARPAGCGRTTAPSPRRARRSGRRRVRARRACRVACSPTASLLPRSRVRAHRVRGRHTAEATVDLGSVAPGAPIGDPSRVASATMAPPRVTGSTERVEVRHVRRRSADAARRRADPPRRGAGPHRGRPRRAGAPPRSPAARDRCPHRCHGVAVGGRAGASRVAVGRPRHAPRRRRRRLRRPHPPSAAG